MDDILASIWCLTFNHEHYIRDAIEGFLSQETNFRYEIVIHDDASTDLTADIIKEYEEKYPEIIRVIYQKENQYSKNYPNIRWIQEIQTRYCKGKYIAVCEGDDFWIDIHKLQIQVEWLEKHPEYSFVSHNAIGWNDITGIKAIAPYKNSKEVSQEEIIMQYHGNIPTASLVIRADTMQMDDFFLKTGAGDWPQQLWCIVRGKGYYFDRIMSVYRAYHENSWTRNMGNDLEKYFDHCLRIIDFLIKYNNYTKYQYDKYVISKIQEYVSIVISMDRENRDFLEWCDKQNFSNDYEFTDYVEEIKRIFRLIKDEYYCDEKLKQFVKQHKYTVLFGAGDFATKLATKFNKNNIQFEGFAVSELKDEVKTYMGKPVWSMDALPFDRKDVGIIVAINPVIWYQIIDTLEKNKYTNYMCPFLLEFDQNKYTKNSNE